jgi:hypothetical protein
MCLQYEEYLANLEKDGEAVVVHVVMWSSCIALHSSSKIGAFAEHLSVMCLSAQSCKGILPLLQLPCELNLCWRGTLGRTALSNSFTMAPLLCLSMSICCYCHRGKCSRR